MIRGACSHLDRPPGRTLNALFGRGRAEPLDTGFETRSRARHESTLAGEPRLFAFAVARAPHPGHDPADRRQLVRRKAQIDR